MKNKLIIFNLITITLVIFILTFAGNYFYQTAMIKSRLQYNTELQKQLSNSFSLTIQSVEKDLEILAKSEDILNYLLQKVSNTDFSKTQIEQNVRDTFYFYEKIHPQYLNLVLIKEDGIDYISNDSYRIVNENFHQEPWFQETLRDGYSYHFYNASRNLKSWKIYDNQTFLSISKAVEVNNTQVGVLMIDVSLEELQKLYRNLEPDTNSFFFLMHTNGQIILSPVNPVVHRIKAEWFDKEEGIVKANILKKSYYLIYNKSINRNLIIVGAYDIAKEQEVIRSFFRVSLTIAILSFVLATIWSIYFMSKITNPLTKLSSLMKTASKGNLEVRFEESCEDEIQLLGDSFNKMVVKIKELLQMVYLEQKQKRDAELQVMQEQIKPHFLYNTLDMIAWMARKHQAHNILHVIELMSNFFRLSLSKGKELIPLGDELKMISYYLEIQQLRYQDLFSSQIICPEKLYSKMVPRMCLQPLVENSIYHGIKESDNECSELQIQVTEIPNGLQILVQDNGKAMDDNIMHRLNQNLSSNNWDKWDGGFGIQNVGKRLWHTFCKGSGLSYYTNENGFTVAQIIILYDREGEQ